MEGVRARRGLQLVSTVVRAFSQQTTDYERLLETIARAIAEAIPDTCVVTTCSEDCATLTPVAIYDRDPEIVSKLDVFRRPYEMAQATFSTDAITHGVLFEPVVDVQVIEQRSSTMAGMLDAIGGRGFIVVPMRAGGELLGLITILRRSADQAPLDELDVEIVEDLGGHAALALYNARLIAKLQSELGRRAAAEHALTISERLRETTQFLDAIVEHIPDMVFVKDAERLAFVRFNRAGEQLLGTPRAELMGKNDYDFFPASEADFFTQKDRETLRNKKLVEIPEEPIHTRGGTRWLHTKKVPLLDEAGVPRFLLGISHDITERKRADAQLRAAKETVENANRELEAFAYSIAHDLRAPLRGILGYSQAVLEDVGDKLDKQPREYLERMQTAAERMATLIDELLGLARVTQADLVRSRVDLSAMAQATLSGLQHADKHRDVEIVIQPDLVVDADPHLMATAIDNLIDNAWKFTAKRERARIEVGRSDEGFYVKDNGAGFDMTYADQLFGVFRRLHPQSDFSGTGIGLATVARIIHRHHGRVWAKGEVDSGAVFYFTLGDIL